jgi:hypothetical protein
MPGFGVVLDPPATAPGRTELNLNSGSIQTVGGEGHGIDWGESAIKAFMAEQLYGEVPTDFRVPNRIVTIPLLLGARQGGTAAEQETARLNLQHKVALFQRQGGVLERKRSNGEPIYADIVNANLIIPDVWEGEVEPSVVLKLECLPDFYGNEVELDAIEEPGQVISVLKKGGATAVIAGDYPARSRIVLSEKGAKAQRGLLWGFRSLHYDPLPTSALFFDAYSVTTLNGAVTGIATGAEPSFSGKTIKLASPEPSTWHPFAELTSTTIVTGASGSEPKTKHLQHIGTYRVWARIKGTAGQRFRLSWSANNATAATINPAMALDETGPWQMIDLGEIRIEEPPIGEHWWDGTIQVNTGATAAECTCDRVWLQPLDDGAGKLRATATPTSSLLGPTKPYTTAANTGAGTAWGNPGNALVQAVAAEVKVPISGESAILKLASAGFSIPEGTTIRGIEVLVPRVALVGGSLGTITGQLYKAGALAGSVKSLAWSVGGVANALGGPSDLWGTTWTPAQINSTANFGIGLIATAGPSVSPKVEVEGPVTVRVYYSYSSSSIAQDAVLFASRSGEVSSEGSYRQDLTTNVYARVSEETGDLPRIPPSGLEGRPCQIFIKNSRGLLPEPGESVAGEADSGIDKVQAQVFYRPCYIGRI